LLIEIVILLLQPYSFFEDIKVKMNDSYDKITFDYKLNYTLVFFGFFKLFIVLRVILTNTSYMSPRCTFLFMKPVDLVVCMGVNPTISMQSSAFLKILRCC